MSQKHAHTMHNSEAGFMGLEGMGTILFYLIMLAGAMVLIAQLFSTSKLVKTATALSAMRVEIKHLYITENNYGHDEANITKIIANAGAIPKSLKYDEENNVIKSPWGTDITIKSKDNGRYFSITVRTPKDKCIQLATYDLTTWHKVTVNGYSITDTSNNVGAVIDHWGTALKDGYINVSFFSE